MKICYIGSSNNLCDLSRTISQCLWQYENMESERFLLPNGEFIVQGRVCNHRILKTIGWDKRIVVRLRPDTERGYSVVLEAPVWIDKAVVLIIAALLGFWALYVVAAWGILDQFQLFQRLQRLLKEI